MTNDTRPARSSFLSDLRTVLAGAGFRKLFAIRLLSRFGDGVFQAGLGTYVFFSRQSYPDPGKAALAFAVLYLPYSLIGPFAGVFIDRWSRRQIMLWSAVCRAGAVALTALLIGSGQLGLPVYLAALLVFGINRFFLSALSAATPHVVPEDELVMANAVAPPLGTLLAFAGGLAGVEVHLQTGGGQAGSVITLLSSGVCYLIAGAVATLLHRRALGPDHEPGEPASERLTAQLAAVLVGLADGARHIAARRRALGALAVTGSAQFLFGIVLLMSILLYRNYFYASAGASVALNHFLTLLAVTGVGAGAAALATPVATRRITKATWITALLACCVVATGGLGSFFAQPGFLILGFVLGTAGQGIGICTTTIYQEEIADSFLGRVFSVNDMVFNVSFVAGATVCAFLIPATGKSLALLLAASGGYLVTAVGYRLISGPSPSPSAATARPLSRAQRSNS
ncbi:MAG TPA: MFS transporter [Streptosporangiaceae bacterium]